MQTYFISYKTFVSLIFNTIFYDIKTVLYTIIALILTIINSTFQIIIIGKTAIALENQTKDAINDFIVFIIIQTFILSIHFTFKTIYLNIINISVESKYLKYNICLPYFKYDSFSQFKIAQRANRQSISIKKAVEIIVFDFISTLIQIILSFHFFYEFFVRQIFLILFFEILIILISTIIIVKYSRKYKQKIVVNEEDFISEINDICKNFILVKLSNENDKNRINNIYNSVIRLIYFSLKSYASEVVHICLFSLQFIIFTKFKDSVKITQTFLIKYLNFVFKVKDMVQHIFDFENLAMELNEMILERNESKEKQKFEIKNKIVFNKNNVFINKKVVLQNMCFELKLGEVYCVTGQNGSGKSTFFKFLLGLYIHDNKVLVDDIEINLYESDVQKSIGYCPSNPYYFEGSIYSNIKDVNDSIEDVIETTKKYGLHDFFLKLKDGYETIMNEQMDKGILQIVNLMKALNKKCKIVLLDEAFTYIDLNITIFLIDRILENVDNKIILTIIHNSKLKEKFSKTIEINNENVLVKMNN